MCEEQCRDYAVAKFIVSDWGNKVDSGIGLSYRPATLHRLAGRYDNPMPALQQSYAGVNYIPPVRDYKFGHWNEHAHFFVNIECADFADM